MIQVKVIVNTINKETLKEIYRYILNLEAYTHQQSRITILDPSYNKDYYTFEEKIKNILGSISDLEVHNLYLQQYFSSDRENNINEYTNNFINGQKIEVEKNDDGHRLFKSEGHTLVSIESDKNNKVNLVEFFNKGNKIPFRRALVNGHGNIQTIRTFDDKSGKAVYEEYVDANLVPFIKIWFNKKGQKESYQFIGWDEPVVNSEVDFNDCWIRKEIGVSDYVINLNRDFDVLFSTFVDVERLFLV
ncbi:hypothetical protein G7084_05440 [Weissella coleopterorum]|uniref:Uncharacterized protein n=1 Tax=Weissella coleopterorum TaxID=2714949 RepID=A0A6G8B0G8_9LACO|nr:hypothetical protein [Weissella coleopterorum]QIL50804.1 hypothetical protein G7084_05440 [Weissella coleopterorum]